MPQATTWNHIVVHTKPEKETAPQIDKSRFNNYRLWTCSVSPVQFTRKMQQKTAAVMVANADAEYVFRLQTTTVSFCMCVDRYGDVKNTSPLPKFISRSTLSQCECVWFTALFFLHYILFCSIARTRCRAIGVRSRHPKES